MNVQANESNPENEASWMTRLPSFLRIFGASALLIAMYSFLIKGWDDGNDVYRYLLMLSHTGILAGIGLASGHWLKESKGARLLLTLSLISIPANFAILGAFIYSKTSVLEAAQYPSYVSWTIDSLQTAGLTTFGALLVLLPVTLLGFSTLARSLSKRLSVLFIISNLTLLIPTREPLIIGLITLALLVMLIFNIKKLAQQHIVAKTREGFAALSLQALPLLILISRTLWLYSADMFLLTLVAVMAYFILQQVSAFLSAKSVLHAVLSILMFVSAVLVAPLLYATLTALNAELAVLFLTVSVTISAIMMFKINNNHSLPYKNISGLFIVAGSVMNMLLNTGFMATALSLVSGIALLFIGYDKKLRLFFINGFILIAIGLSQQLYDLVYEFDFSSWISMAVMGVITIVIASVIEAKGATLVQHYSTWKEKFNHWEG